MADVTMVKYIFLFCTLSCGRLLFAQTPGMPYKSEYTTSKASELGSCSGGDLEFVPGQFVVQFKTDANDSQKVQLEEALHVRMLKSLPSYSPKLLNGVQIKFEELRLYELVETTRGLTKQSLNEILETAKHFPGVRFAEPNIVYRATDHTANDKYYTAGLLWGVYSNDSPIPIGPPGTTSEFGSQAEKAWARDHIGSSQLYVGIIDSGIQVEHPDLKDNVDAADSKDFYYTSAHRVDVSEYAHGTHVAGIIGALGGNGIGVAGIVWSVQMISAKFIGPGGIGNLFDASAAIRYLTLLKVNLGRQIVVLNNSWSSNLFSSELLGDIKNAARAGMVIVAAAGNTCSDNDLTPSYPASYDTKDNRDDTPGLEYSAVLSVTAIDKNGELPQFSNYGRTSVHLGAPGVDIYSTYAGDPGSYRYMSGTSMAAAFVSGAVVLYASTHPQATPQMIIAAILETTVPTPKLQGKTSTGGRLSVASF